MIDRAYWNKIMDEYLVLLEKYDGGIEFFDESDIKRLIGEVKRFWYRKHKFINYTFANITNDDNVSFLAGSVMLDVPNAGHCEFVLSGKVRIINDPLYKMSSFYKVDEKIVNIQKANKYVKECIQDMLCILRNYPGDFYIIPLDYITDEDEEEYYRNLLDISNRLIIVMFSNEYESIDEFYEDNESFEDIEHKLRADIRDRLIFSNSGDLKLSLREKCEKYVRKNTDSVPIIDSMSEPELFVLLASQFLMQSVAILLYVKHYKLIPFIRNEVTFSYFDLVYHSNLVELDESIFLHAFITFLIQYIFDFGCCEYQELKEKIGDDKLIQSVIKSLSDIDSTPENIAKAVSININEMIGTK